MGRAVEDRQMFVSALDLRVHFLERHFVALRHDHRAIARFEPCHQGLHAVELTADHTLHLGRTILPAKNLQQLHDPWALRRRVVLLRRREYARRRSVN